MTDGKVDILIANAGATWGEAFDTHSDAAFDKVMNLNVRSVFNLIRLCTPLLEKAARQSSEKARVVTVGSVAGLHIGGIGQHGTYGYAASKAAVMVCALVYVGFVLWREGGGKGERDCFRLMVGYSI